MNAKNVIFHLSVIIMTSLYGFQETTVRDVREALDEYISKHMQERMSDIRYIESFGIHYSWDYIVSTYEELFLQ